MIIKKNVSPNFSLFISRFAPAITINVKLSKFYKIYKELELKQIDWAIAFCAIQKEIISVEMSRLRKKKVYVSFFQWKWIARARFADVLRQSMKNDARTLIDRAIRGTKKWLSLMYSLPNSIFSISSERKGNPWDDSFIQDEAQSLTRRWRMNISIMSPVISSLDLP